MTTMNADDTWDQRAVFKLLGELSADVKHILSALDRSKMETEKLREEVHKETDDLKKRLTKVEKFNVRVLTYASIALPVLTVGLGLGKELLFLAIM